MADSTNTFVDEIYDQFLVCRMCSEVYKNPKVLTCMHSFCEKCLENHYEMEEQERPYRFLLYTRALSCPICHSRTELPTGGIHRLPDNFLVANLADVVNRRRPAEKNAFCEICRPGSRNEMDGEREEKEKNEEKQAVCKCLDCVKMLCKTCAELHRNTRVTQNHGLFDIQIDKDIECKLHPNDIIRFYCEQCEECICVLCTFHEHKEHDVSSLLEALDRHRGPFEKLIDRCRDRVDRLKEQVELIDKCETGLRLAEEHIRDTAIESIAAIRKREKDLLAELRETLGEQTLEFIAEKETFKENLKNLENTFNITNAMLENTSIDLLMVKKEMQEKITTVLNSDIKKTPETLQRNVQFCREDYFMDIRKAAVDHMDKIDRFSRRTEVEKDGTDNRKLESKSVQTDSSGGPEIKDKISKSSDQELTRVELEINSGQTPECQVAVQKISKEWQRPEIVVVPTEIPRIPPTVTLRPVTGRRGPFDRGTQTEVTLMVDKCTFMPKVHVMNKETSTRIIRVFHKNVSTDNQQLVDKSTSMAVDVTAAYRGVSSTKRLVMVSRGTCTPRMMMLDKETLPITTHSSTRACSPVVWPNTNQTNAINNPEQTSSIVLSPSFSATSSAASSSPTVTALTVPSSTPAPSSSTSAPTSSTPASASSTNASSTLCSPSFLSPSSSQSTALTAPSSTPVSAFSTPASASVTHASSTLRSPSYSSSPSSQSTATTLTVPSSTPALSSSTPASSSSTPAPALSTPASTSSTHASSTIRSPSVSSPSSPSTATALTVSPRSTSTFSSLSSAPSPAAAPVSILSSMITSSSNLPSISSGKISTSVSPSTSIPSISIFASTIPVSSYKPAVTTSSSISTPASAPSNPAWASSTPANALSTPASLSSSVTSSLPS